MSKTIEPMASTIESAFRTISADLQTLNAYRYARQITGGIQEYMESMLFQHYLETQKLLSYEAAAERLNKVFIIEQENIAKPEHLHMKQEQSEHPIHEPESSEALPVICASLQNLLTAYDYLLGLFDMTGEVMRFAITSMATTTSTFLPPSFTTSTSDDGWFVNEDHSKRPRSTLADLQNLRGHLEVLNYDYKSDRRFASDADAKLKVTRTSVEKVERALYGLIVRGSERPEGWMPEINDGGARDGPELLETY